jgi:hypothetical protein
MRNLIWLVTRIHPVILCVGRPLFKERGGRPRLEVVRGKILRSGVVALLYNLAGGYTDRLRWWNRCCPGG